MNLPSREQMLANAQAVQQRFAPSTQLPMPEHVPAPEVMYSDVTPPSAATGQLQPPLPVGPIVAPVVAALGDAANAVRADFNATGANANGVYVPAPLPAVAPVGIPDRGVPPAETTPVTELPPAGPPSPPAAAPAAPTPRGTTAVAPTGLEKQQDALFAEKARLDGENKAFLANEQLKANEEANKLELHKQALEDAGMDEIKKINGLRAGYMDQLTRTEIDPERYFKSQSAASNFMTGISILLGGALQGAGGSSTNPGLDALNRAVDRDIDAQKFHVHQLAGLADMAGATAGDRLRLVNETRIMEGDRRAHFWDMTSRRLSAEAQKRGIPLDNIAYQQAQNLIDQQRKAAQQSAQAAVNAAALKRMDREQERIDKLTIAALPHAEGSYGDVRAAVQGPFKGPDGKVYRPDVPLKGDPQARKAEGERAAELDGLKTVNSQFDRLAELAPQLSSHIGVGDTVKTQNAKDYDDTASAMSIAVTKSNPGLHSDQDTLRVIQAYAPRYTDSPEKIAMKKLWVQRAAAGKLSQAEIDKLNASK